MLKVGNAFRASSPSFTSNSLKDSFCIGKFLCQGIFHTQVLTYGRSYCGFPNLRVLRSILTAACNNSYREGIHSELFTNSMQYSVHRSTDNEDSSVNVSRALEKPGVS